MSDQSSINGNHLLADPAECYWGMLDVSVLPRRNRSDPKRLGYLMESSLPCPIDEVHAVYHTGSQPQVIGCGIPRDRLTEIVQEHGGALLSFTPRSIPGFASAGDVDPSSLNLLTGSFEPVRIRQLRRRWVVQILLIAAVVGALLTVGFERRRLAVANELAQVNAENAQRIDEVLGNSAGATSLPREQRLVSALRRLEQTRAIDRSSDMYANEQDLAQSFFEVLSAWPEELHAQTEALVIASNSITVRGQVTTSGDAQTLADALAVVDGWTVRQPQISSMRDGVQVTVALQPLTAEAANR